MNTCAEKSMFNRYILYVTTATSPYMSAISDLLQISFFHFLPKLQNRLSQSWHCCRCELCYYIMGTAMEIFSWKIWLALVIPTIYLHAVYINSYAGFSLCLAPLDKNYYQCGLHKLHVVYSIWKPYFSSKQCLIMNTLPYFLTGRLFLASLWLHYSYDLRRYLAHETNYLNIHTAVKKGVILFHVLLVTRWLPSLKCSALNYPHL